MQEDLSPTALYAELQKVKGNLLWTKIATAVVFAMLAFRPFLVEMVRAPFVRTTTLLLDDRQENLGGDISAQNDGVEILSRDSGGNIEARLRLRVTDSRQPTLELLGAGDTVVWSATAETRQEEVGGQ